MFPGARSRISIVAPLAIVIVAASSCASIPADPERGSSAQGSSLERPIDAPADFEFGSIGASDAGSDAGAEPPAAALVDSTVAVRTGDTLGDLATAVDAPTPATIEIESLEIEAPIVPVGIDADGAFDLPPGNEAGWYRFGPAPGAEGSAVLAAHVDWNGEPGAFFTLHEAEGGERLSVVYDDGSIVEFEIVSIEEYSKTELPLEELFTRDGEPQLALITCGGDFDRATRSYESNVVVIAVPA